MSGELLPEIAEAEARGSIAEAYRDIRHVLGVPLVNLVYRHLATFPGLLEDVWRHDLRPNMKSASVTGLTPGLGEGTAGVEVVSIPTAALRAVGVGEDEQRRIRATLDVFAHANTRNLVAVIALLDGAPGTSQEPDEEPPRRTESSVEPLPTVPLSELAAPVVALLGEMGSAIVAPGSGVLVPSLFRHFAHRPALLALMWTALQPAVEGDALDQTVSRIESRARTVAAELPCPVGRIDHVEARAGLERFAIAIPRMIVVGMLLTRSVGAGSDV